SGPAAVEPLLSRHRHGQQRAGLGGRQGSPERDRGPVRLRDRRGHVPPALVGGDDRHIRLPDPRGPLPGSHGEPARLARLARPVDPCPGQRAGPLGGPVGPSRTDLFQRHRGGQPRKPQSLLGGAGPLDLTRPRAVVDLGCDPAVPGESPEVTALVDRAKTGDADAFSDLVRLYEGRIIAIGMQMGLSREDALDACQDTFLKVFNYIGGFRSGLIFYRWLHRIAIHAIYDRFRWSRPAGVISFEELDPAGAGAGRRTGDMTAQVESA